MATQIQSSMLPCIFPAFPERGEFDVYASMTPAKEVGGDFYDFFLVDEDHLALVIADVSGKGVPAALFMVIAKTLLKNRAQMGASPKEILETVNNQLCENNDAEMFVTVWLGIYEISTGRVTAANAGHEYPAIRRKGGAFELFRDKHGFVLAGMENMRYREYEFTLADGVLEELGCPAKAKAQLDVAIDELFSNIARYAYAPGEGRATVRVEAFENPRAVELTFIDSGVPYDPLAREDPNTRLPIEKREAGGLGVFIVKKTMDAVSYEYADGQNILRIRKLI